MSRLLRWLGLAAACLGIAAWLAILRPSGPPLPDFTQWPAGPERKDRFFEFLRPLFAQRNAEIAAERDRLQTLAAAGTAPTGADRRWLHDLAEYYGVDPQSLEFDELTAELLLRVDAVPVSLGLAQAAKESGWGTSRFAQEGNALFGQRCHQSGCGMVPQARSVEASFEVRAFPSPWDAVVSYVHNLNTHPDYQALRELRADLRARGRRVTGFALARTLHGYSERGPDYAEEIRQMIHFNGLGPVAGDA